MNHLVFAGGGLYALRDQLLSSAAERAALLLAQAVTLGPHSGKLVVSEAVLVADHAYSRQSEHGLEVPPQILAPVIKRARNERKTIVVVHTHPWDGAVTPSHTDHRGEALLLPT